MKVDVGRDADCLSNGCGSLYIVFQAANSELWKDSGP